MKPCRIKLFNKTVLLMSIILNMHCLVKPREKKNSKALYLAKYKIFYETLNNVLIL